MPIVNGIHPTRMHSPNNQTPSRILIVADLQIARIGIARMLRDCADFVLCGEADSPRTLESIAELKPSLLLKEKLNIQTAAKLVWFATLWMDQGEPGCLS